MPKYMSSPVRWVVLQTLADASGPLDRTQLATLSGATPNNVLAVLIRPVRAGWVSTVRIQARRVNERRLLYTITDLGRQILAEHRKENPA